MPAGNLLGLGNRSGPGGQEDPPLGWGLGTQEPSPGQGFCFVGRMGVFTKSNPPTSLKFWWGPAGGGGSSHRHCSLCILGILLKPTCWEGRFVL